MFCNFIMTYFITCFHKVAKRCLATISINLQQEQLLSSQNVNAMFIIWAQMRRSLHVFCNVSSEDDKCYHSHLNRLNLLQKHIIWIAFLLPFLSLSQLLLTITY